MPAATPKVQVEEEHLESISVNPEELHDFTCERCGYIYRKSYDYKPFLCYRCIRYIAKKTFTIMHTIQPSISAPIESTV